MVENIIQNNGFNIALSGIIVVFAGLILIATIIHLFNKFFERLHRRSEQAATDVTSIKSVREKKIVPISDDELVAVATALECYRRIHFETLQSRITFKHGEQKTAWTSGQRFSQRRMLLKRT